MADNIMTNKKSVPTFEGRLYTGEELHGLSGNWVRRAEVDTLLDEVEQLRGNLSMAEEGLANYALEVKQLTGERAQDQQRLFHYEGAIAEQRAAIEQLHAAVKTAQELAATRLMEIERLSKREKDLMDVIDSRDRALGFVPLDEVHASEPLPVAGWNKCECAGCPGLIPSQGASRDASPGSNAWADAKGGLPDNTL